MGLLAIIRSIGLRLAYRATMLVRSVVINLHPATASTTQRLPQGWTPSGRVIDVPVARSEAVTTPIPFSEANWIAVVRLQPVVMPVAADLAASRARTVELPRAVRS